VALAACPNAAEPHIKLPDKMTTPSRFLRTLVLLSFVVSAAFVGAGNIVVNQTASGSTLIASDNFDSYSNGADLDTSSGGTWVNVHNNVLVYKPGSDGSTYTTASQGWVRHTGTYSANQRSEATIEAIGTSFNFVGVSVRNQSGADTHYHLQVDGSVYYLMDRIAGSQTIITGHSGVSLALSVGDKIALEANGTEQCDPTENSEIHERRMVRCGDQHRPWRKPLHRRRNARHWRRRRNLHHRGDRQLERVQLVMPSP
jgi:hypothetical protein